jgi:hypothetical protein
MTEKEIIEAELKSVEEHKAEVQGKLEELTQHLGRMNLLHNIYSKHLKESGGAPPEDKNSSES